MLYDPSPSPARAFDNNYPNMNVATVALANRVAALGTRVGRLSMCSTQATLDEIVHTHLPELLEAAQALQLEIVKCS